MTKVCTLCALSSGVGLSRTTLSYQIDAFRTRRDFLDGVRPFHLILSSSPSFRAIVYSVVSAPARIFTIWTEYTVIFLRVRSVPNLSQPILRGLFFFHINCSCGELNGPDNTPRYANPS